MIENNFSKEIHTDRISSIDELGRKKFATEIALNIIHHIESYSESIVIGIHGPWGSGKSNLLHFIKEDIKKNSLFANTIKEDERRIGKLEKYGLKQKTKSINKKLYLLDFNPWIFSGKEQLHNAFLKEFAIKVQSKSQQLRSKLESFSKRIKWVGDLNNLGAAAHRGITAFTEISVENLKEETNQILQNENIHVVVIIDDIDRLAPSEMLEVFQLVKLNANFVNTIFIISFDKSIVSKSIFNTYHFDGESYLEKIIQVDYNIPSIPTEDLESIFFNRLNKFLGKDSTFDTSSLHSPWLIHGLRFYFRNIRDLNRYFNSVSFRLPVMLQEVNLHDFLLIEAIRLFDYDSYQIIRDNYKESVQFGSNSHFAFALKNISKGSAKQIYDYLFNSNNKQNKLSPNEFRIYDPDFFDRYFTLSISKKDSREEEFINFIHYPSTRINLLISLIKNNKIDFLLRRIIARVADYKDLNLIPVISPLLNVWVDYKEEFAEHWRTVWSAIKAIVKTSNDLNIGYQKLLDDISVSTTEFNPARFTFQWLVLQSIYQEDEKNIDPDLKSNYEFFNSNRDKIETSFKFFLENQSLFLFEPTTNELYQRIFLLSYARLLPEKYELQFKQIMNDNQRILLFLDKLIFKDSDSRKTIGINYQTVNMLLPQNLKAEFNKRLNSIKPEALSKEKQDSLTYFLSNFKN